MPEDFVAPAPPDAAAADRSASDPGQALQFTVHDPGIPAAEAVVDEGRTRRGRTWMILVWLVCAAPVVASYLTFYVFRPTHTRNFGDLIDPPRPMPASTAVRVEAAGAPEQKPLAALQGQWLLVSVAPAACGPRCEQNLYYQRQMRETTGREKERIDWVWLITDEAEVSPKLQAATQAALRVRMPADQVAAWLSPAPGHALGDHVFVVDPRGEWMLRFPADMDMEAAAKARRDIDRLLRASASWDRPGRSP